MKKFIFLLVLVIAGLVYIMKADIKPEPKEVSKEVKNLSLDKQ